MHEVHCAEGFYRASRPQKNEGFRFVELHEPENSDMDDEIGPSGAKPLFPGLNRPPQTTLEPPRALLINR